MPQHALSRDAPLTTSKPFFPFASTGSCARTVTCSRPIKPPIRTRPAVQLKLGFRSGANVAFVLVEAEGSHRLSHRPDYDREQYLRRMEHDGQGNTHVELAPPAGPFALLRGLVEANQQFCTAHAQTQGGGKPSWASMTSLPWPGQQDPPRGMTARFHLESVVRTPERLFLIRSLRVAGQTPEQAAEFCFFYDIPAKAEKQRTRPKE